MGKNKKSKSLPTQAAVQASALNFQYNPSWERSAKRLSPQALKAAKVAMDDYAANPANPKFRMQIINRLRKNNIFSIDLFRIQSTLYKALLKKVGNDTTMLWVGTHEEYNKILDSDWILKQ